MAMSLLAVALAMTLPLGSSRCGWTRSVCHPDKVGCKRCGPESAEGMEPPADELHTQQTHSAGTRASSSPGNQCNSFNTVRDEPFCCFITDDQWCSDESESS